MRKAQQNQILALLDTLLEAADELRVLAGKGQADSALSLLADCQEVAVALGESIEKVSDRGTATITLLEEYCELLYQTSLALQTPENVPKSIKRLRVKLAATRTRVLQDMPVDKIEIAFFPYKASMFDSMESIWRTANADPDCDAYVIPIPYYNKQLNGSVSQAPQYEGNLLPADIPVTDWEEYDVEARRPDVIFFHNPYDNTNTVTTVHPDFYADRLRDFTDMLVYVPYFVTTGSVPDSLCIAPGTMYSSHVILQSESVRQRFIRTYKLFTQQRSYGNRFGIATEKFLALGSPKFDRPINAAPNDYELPDAWRTLIDHPTGRKKVVLYNTSISTLLNGRGDVLHKLRQVFDYFKGQSNLVLWWRPHPLNDATYRSLQPTLVTAYQALVDQYRQEGFGIYDDTSDLDRAILASDAYYGDNSSLVLLYQATGKPVILQNLQNALSGRKRERFHFDFIAEHNGEIWFTDSRFGGLFRMDQDELEPSLAHFFPGERRLDYFYGQPVIHGDALILPPRRATAIEAFSLSGSVSPPLPQLPPVDINYIPSRFFAAIAHGRYIYFTPSYYPAILQLDTQSRETRLFNDWTKQLDALTESDKVPYFRLPVQNGHLLVLASCRCNAVLVFDMESQKSTIHRVGKENYRYGGICFDGEAYWLSPLTNTPLVRWHPKDGILQEIIHPFDECITGQSSYFPPVYYDGTLLLLPLAAKDALRVDVKTGNVTPAPDFAPGREEADVNPLAWAWSFAKIIGSRLYAYHCLREELVIHDFETGEHISKALTVPPEVMALAEEESLKAYMRGVQNATDSRDCYLRENGFFTLPQLMEHFVLNANPDDLSLLHQRQTSLIRAENTNADGTAGAAIYEWCKEKALRGK